MSSKAIHEKNQPNKFNDTHHVHQILLGLDYFFLLFLGVFAA